jgi:hypothetical protein
VKEVPIDDHRLNEDLRMLNSPELCCPEGEDCSPCIFSKSGFVLGSGSYHQPSKLHRSSSHLEYSRHLEETQITHESYIHHSHEDGIEGICSQISDDGDDCQSSESLPSVVNDDSVEEQFEELCHQDFTLNHLATEETL